MSDFFARLAGRLRGETQVARPEIGARFALAQTSQPNNAPVPKDAVPETWPAEPRAAAQAGRAAPGAPAAFSEAPPGELHPASASGSAVPNAPEHTPQRRQPDDQAAASQTRPTRPAETGRDREASAFQPLLSEQTRPAELPPDELLRRTVIPDDRRQFPVSPVESSLSPGVPRPETQPAATPPAALVPDPPAQGLADPGSSLAAALQPRPAQAQARQPDLPQPESNQPWLEAEQRPPEQHSAVPPAVEPVRVATVRPRLDQPGLPPAQAVTRGREHEQLPPVQIKIGRIEVQAEQAVSQPQAAPQLEIRAPALSLQDYLRERNEAKR